ncbi:type I restriction enzyme, S subunit [Bacteroidales bacterium KHT7]|nr:type I restriction enzyme, S subunit [Bacteroidales bacterium KHT7]
MNFIENNLGRIFSEAFHSGDPIKSEDINQNGLFPVFGGNGLRGYTDRYNQDGEYVIIGRQGAYCGNARYYKGKAFLTEHAIVAKPSSDYDVVYLSCLLSAINLSKFQGQSAQPGLSVKTLSNIEVRHHDCSTQKKIGSLLYNIDCKIALNRAINQNLAA